MTNRASWDSFLVRACATASIAVAMSAPLTKASAQSIADTFRGKTIKMLLPTAPGGGRALYALPFAEAYGRHIPGNPTVLPVFMPGAGGSTAVNNAYGVAEHDGLTIVSPLKSVESPTRRKSSSCRARSLRARSTTSAASRSSSAPSAERL
jgi:tripartite-type tricarboxylate transporter receptor subunit TctC